MTMTTAPTQQAHDPGHDGAPRMGRLGTWKVWLMTTSVFTVFAAVFFGSSAPFAIPRVEDECGMRPPDVRFTSSSADVEQFLAACGTVGRDAYGNMLLADVFYPAVFALFLASSLTLVFRQMQAHRRWFMLVWLPVIGAGFDYLENGLAWRALATFPRPVATTAVLGLASAAKTTIFWLAGVTLLAAVATLVIRRLFGNDQDASPSVGP